MKEDIFLGCQREMRREKARQAFITMRVIYTLVLRFLYLQIALRRVMGFLHEYESHEHE